MTRDEIRVWVERLSIPEMRLTYGEGEFDRSPVAPRRGVVVAATVGQCPCRYVGSNLNL